MRLKAHLVFGQRFLYQVNFFRQDFLTDKFLIDTTRLFRGLKMKYRKVKYEALS